MPDWIRYILVATLTAVLVGGLKTLLGRGKPAEGGAEAGAIAPDRITTVVCMVFCVGFVALGVAIIRVTGGDGGPVGPAGWLMGLAIIVLAVAGFVLLIPSLTDLYIVRWSAVGIEGPAKTFGPVLGRARATLAWDDLYESGTTDSQYWYVEDRRGERVYWAYTYRGHRALAAAIRRRRPDLALPGDM